MHNFEIKKELDDIMKKLYRKDRNLHEQIMNKINEIVNSESLDHYKYLRYNMKDSQRVHVGHFVLVFSFNKTDDLILFEYFDHHDNIYG